MSEEKIHAMRIAFNLGLAVLDLHDADDPTNPASSAYNNYRAIAEELNREEPDLARIDNLTDLLNRNL
jgi:hypothetical protein